MAVRLLRKLTLAIFLTLSVATLSVSMSMPVVAQADGLAGSAYGTTGDPDQPKDSGPRPVHATTTSSANSSSMTLVEVSEPQKDQRARLDRGKFWKMSELLIRNLIGRPGLLREGENSERSARGGSPMSVVGRVPCFQSVPR